MLMLMLMLMLKNLLGKSTALPLFSRRTLLGSTRSGPPGHGGDHHHHPHDYYDDDQVDEDVQNKSQRTKIPNVVLGFSWWCGFAGNLKGWWCWWFSQRRPDTRWSHFVSSRSISPGSTCWSCLLCSKACIVHIYIVHIVHIIWRANFSQCKLVCIDLKIGI